MMYEVKTWDELLEDGWRVTTQKLQVDLLDEIECCVSDDDHYKTKDEDEIVVLMELPDDERCLELLRTYDLNPLI